MPYIETIFDHEADSGAIGELGIDEKGRLYWNGKPVVTEQKVTLQWWVNLSAIVAAISTLLMAIVSIIAYFDDAKLHDKYFKSATAYESKIETYKRELEELETKKSELIDYIESHKNEIREQGKTLNKPLQPTQKPRG